MTTQHLIASLITSGLTLYMMAILLQWLGPRLELEFRGFWSIIPRSTEPLIELMKRILPPMGPMDISPLAAVVAVYIVRLIIVGA